MSPLLKDLEAKALQLPVAEREALANHLFQSVHNQEINEVEEAWLKVADERFEALRNGSDAGLSEKMFFDQVNRR